MIQIEIRLCRISNENRFTGKKKDSKKSFLKSKPHSEMTRAVKKENPVMAVNHVDSLAGFVVKSLSH